MEQTKPLLTRNALLLLVGSFLFFGTQSLLLPTFPLYIATMGGDERAVGLLAGLFALAAVCQRPFFSRLAGRKGCKMVLLIAAFAATTGPLLYPFCRNFLCMATARVYHASSLAGFITASQTMLADLSQPGNRGKMFGYYGVASGSAMAIAPAIGVKIAGGVGYQGLFLVSAFLGGAIIAISLFIADAPTEVREAVATPASVSETIRNRWVTVPSAALFCLTMAFGAITAFVPLHSAETGIGSSGAYFAVLSAASMIGRLVSGGLSDRYGRREVAAPALLCSAAGVGLLTTATGPAMLVASATLFGLGFATAHTALLALVADKTTVRERSQAVSFYANAFDVGTAAGSIGLGALARHSYSAVYGILTACVFTGFGLIARVLPGTGSRGPQDVSRPQGPPEAIA
ncbi:MAG: MFS transporter [Bacillota bacterium]